MLALLLRPRTSHVIAASLVLTGAIVFAAHLAFIAPSRSEHQADVDKIAAYRYEHVRGMTRCESYHTDTISRARRALRMAGIPDPGLIAVVTPTFHGAGVVAFTDSAIHVLRFSGDTGYTRPEAWFDMPEGPPVITPIAYEQAHTILAPLIRHARYPSSAARRGHDGVVYLLDWAGECSYTWSPREGDGPSELIARMLDEIMASPASVEVLEGLSHDIANMERGIAR